MFKGWSHRIVYVNNKRMVKKIMCLFCKWLSQDSWAFYIHIHITNCSKLVILFQVSFCSMLLNPIEWDKAELRSKEKFYSLIREQHTHRAQLCCSRSRSQCWVQYLYTQPSAAVLNWGVLPGISAHTCRAEVLVQHFASRTLV